MIMKKLSVVIAIILIAVSPVFAQAGKKVYQKYSDSKGVEATYISGSLFKMMGSNPEVIAESMAEGVDISGIVANISGMYVLDTEVPEIAAKLREDITKSVRAKEMELLLENRSDSEETSIYFILDGNDITSVVISTFEPGETTWVCIEGRFTRGAINGLISGMNK